VIDDSNREEVLERLDSIVWSYYIQIVSLDALIEISENIDKIQIMEENNESLKAQKIKLSVDEEKSEDKTAEGEIQQIIEKSWTQKISHGEYFKLLGAYISLESEKDREKFLKQLPDDLKKQIENSSKQWQELHSRLASALKPLTETLQIIEGMFKGIARIVESISYTIKKIDETKRKVLMRSLLIYAISIWESFLREYLRVILLYNWEILREVKKEYKISYGELLERLQDYETLDDLRSELIDDYLYKLFHKSIDKIADELKRLMLIELKEFPKWKELREAYYRRNIITHNNGIINRVYCKEVGLKDCKIGKEVEVTPEYLRNISSIISDFIDYVHRTICEKYKLDIV